jgi:hypothetical protein
MLLACLLALRGDFLSKVTVSAGISQSVPSIGRSQSVGLIIYWWMGF